MKLIGCLLSPLVVVVVVIGVLFLLLMGLLGAIFGGGNGLPTGPGNSEIAQYAQEMAFHLHDGGPNGFDVVMDSGFPQGALDFWDKVCGYTGCASKLSGNLQCGQFIGMAYGWAGLPLVGANVTLDWWTAYGNDAQGNPKHAGWTEIANGTGLPEPGDILIFDTPPGPFAGEGHGGIVLNVQPPLGKSYGAVVFAEANGPTPFVTMPLAPNGAVQVTWRGYTVKGFIRHTSAPAGGKTAIITVRHDQLAQSEYDTTGFYTWANWAYSACSAGALANVIDAYEGNPYRIVDILRVEYNLGVITPQQGLLEEAGIAKTAAQFGFSDQSTTTYSLEQVVMVAQSGHPVIVNFPPDRFAGGHYLVVTGGLVGTDGLIKTVYVVDSGFDRNSISRSQFLQWWGGQIDILTPNA
jgi:hypothetical protein